MAVLSELEPKRVFHYFEEMSQIPRPSYQEKAISDYLVNFAKEHNLEYYQDKLYNVIMIKPATAGYEDVEPIIIQGHMDMVCEKEADCTKDMEKEGLDLEVNGDFVSAKGTTLGGDDGVAVAFALALLEDETLQHPRLEVIITVSEEVGMDGAREIDLSMLQGKRMLNLDSEKEGEVLASCAGGGTARISLPIERQELAQGPTIMGVAQGAAAYRELVMTGLLGGHSGDEIDKGRGNATMLMARTLATLTENLPIQLVNLTGGSKDNAIPRESKAIVVLPKDKVTKFEEIVASVQEAILSEYSMADPNIHIDVNAVEERNLGEMLGVETKVLPLSTESTSRVINLLLSLPNGIQRMSDAIPGLVETSLNLGITKMDAEYLQLGFSIRSSVGAAYVALRQKVTFVSRAFGATVAMNGEYPAWEYVQDSPLRDKLCAIYKEMFGKDLEVRAIHAGLECGLLSGKIEGLDAVSMGPDLYDIHTPGERLSISSTQRMYDFVRNIIETK
ncbi:MAG: aminoacyl-histidine dipeptidase [Lachnospiraceae bacterium]|nr:aminoacyl-histidine dipeptidase [Lachnospiraceae bacterium]